MNPSNDRTHTPAEANWFARTVVALSLFPLAAFLLTRFSSLWWIAELAGHFRVQLLFLFAPFPVLLFLCGRKKLAGLMLVGTFFLLCEVVPIFLPTQQPNPGSETLKIMSVNVLDSNQDAEKLLELINRVEPDVIVALEFTSFWQTALESLHGQYPYRQRQPATDGTGIGMYSKRPLNRTRWISLDSQLDSPAMWAEIDLDGRPLSLVGAHPMSPTGYARFSARNRQLKSLADRIQQSNNPVIAVGDFNSTTWSPYLKRFLKRTGLRDSRQGLGLQPSWPQWQPLLMIPIDHVFISPEIHLHSRRVESHVGSDHFPILVEISVATNQQ